MKNNIEAVAKILRRPVRVGRVIDAPQLTRYELIPLSNDRSTPTRYTHLKNLLPDFSARLGIANLSISQDSSIWLDVPKEAPVNIDASRIFAPEMTLPILLGVGIDRRVLAFDMAKPSQSHLLIAGSTGSGKSVLLNTILTTLLREKKPEELSLVLIDPKLVELHQYRTVQHVRGRRARYNKAGNAAPSDCCR
jgi:S-DNA-T family DNA segregation ATPase FtsK/SpoIIIE